MVVHAYTRIKTHALAIRTHISRPNINYDYILPFETRNEMIEMVFFYLCIHARMYYQKPVIDI